MKTAEDIRRALEIRYPDPEDDQVSIEFFGFIHEHPMTAIAVVLISSIVLGTTDVNRLAEFTGHSKRFMRAIASNMGRTAGFGKMASITAQSGRLATSYLVIDTRRANLVITLASQRAPVGQKKLSHPILRMPPRFFGTKSR